MALDLSPVAVLGDRPLLERLVANLVENGVRHNHPGGRVEVALFPSAGLAPSALPGPGAAWGSVSPSPDRWPPPTAAP